MRALVLTAGLGTRLRPLTLARAKAAAPVDGESLARRTIRWLVSHGVRDLVLNLHHKPDTITADVGDGSDMGARVRYSWESPVLGSAGGPRRALPLLQSPPRRSREAAEAGTFFLVNGDTLTDVDLPAMLDQHRRTGALVTMALIPNPDPSKYGGVRLDDRGAVTAFTKRGSPGPSLHFIGPQVVEAGAFAALEDGVVSESVLGIYPRYIAERPGSIRGFVSAATFRDIGTPADLLRTSLDLAAADGRAGCPRWGRNVRVDPSARVVRSALWDNVTVGAGATITDCVLADRVVIPPGAEYHRCAIVSGVDGLLVSKLDGN
jgi:NDP-sugar pyrophosphorylase family protein